MIFIQAGGKWYDVETGRRDGRISLKSEAQANIPPPEMPIPKAIELFAKKGLNKDDFVVLLGNHLSHAILTNKENFKFF